MVRASGESVGTGEGTPVEPGKYHVSVTKCEEHTAKTGTVGFLCEFEILAGTRAGHEGKGLKYQTLYGPKIFAFAAAVGLVDHLTGEVFTPNQFRAMQAAKRDGKPVDDCDFEPAEAEGRQLCIEVVLGEEKQEGKNAGKRFPEIGWGIWAVDAPESADIPKDADALRLLGYDVPDSDPEAAQQQQSAPSTASRQQATKQATKPAAQSTTTTKPPAGKFAGLR